MIKSVEAARKEFEKLTGAQTTAENKQGLEAFDKIWTEIFRLMVKFKTRSIALTEEHSWFAKDERTVSAWFIGNAERFLKPKGYTVSVSVKTYSKDGMGRVFLGRDERVRTLFISLD
jgi:hypothetical protein